MLKSKVTAVPATAKDATESHTLIGRIPTVYYHRHYRPLFHATKHPIRDIPACSSRWLSLIQPSNNHEETMPMRGWDAWFWCPRLHDHAVTLSKNLVSQKVSVATNLYHFEILCSWLRIEFLTTAASLCLFVYFWYVICQQPLCISPRTLIAVNVRFDGWWIALLSGKSMYMYISMLLRSGIWLVRAFSLMTFLWGVNALQSHP